MTLTDGEVGSFIAGAFLATVVWLLLIGASFVASSREEVPAIECIQGELYDVTKEGNITIKDKRFDVTCEETQ